MRLEDHYVGREQTLVKHFILQKYLERFAHIVGSHWATVTYVDCFSGPWNVRSDNFADSSFAIALNELRKARDTRAQLGRNLQIRCFFLEKEPTKYARLKQFADSVTDATIETRNAPLEESIADILNFVRMEEGKTFPFIFIDPSGWTGFDMDMIAPLLRLNPGEVLINFMTSHIRRFLDSPEQQTQDSFKRLFGSEGFREKIQGLAHKDRDDAAVQEYALNAMKVGDFHYACTAVVLHPEIDRTHFHLIYLTRKRKGVQVFKDAEKKAMEIQEQACAEARQRKQVTRTGQPELFGGQEMGYANHYNLLRDRYITKARLAVTEALQRQRRMLYDDAWILAVSVPMVWETDLKDWIREWKDKGYLEIEGMQPRQRVPHLSEGNYLLWK